jgi:hypothetical protein
MEFAVKRVVYISVAARYSEIVAILETMRFPVVVEDDAVNLVAYTSVAATYSPTVAVFATVNAPFTVKLPFDRELDTSVRLYPLPDT